jgi:hypothetical protein
MVEEHVARPRPAEPGASSANKTFPLVISTRTAGGRLAGDADADTDAAGLHLAGDADADTDAAGRPRRPALASELLVPRM